MHHPSAAEGDAHDESVMGAEGTRPPKLPPPWFKHAFWPVHRAAEPDQWRALPLDPGEQTRVGGAAAHRARTDVGAERPSSSATSRTARTSSSSR